MRWLRQKTSRSTVVFLQLHACERRLGVCGSQQKDSSGCPSTCVSVEKLLTFNGYCCWWLIFGDFTAPYCLRGNCCFSSLKSLVEVAFCL